MFSEKINTMNTTLTIRECQEWSIKAPWGNIALASWGDPGGKPVLLVHGRQDSLSTFLPLLQYLPATYQYVGIDLPGHGKSDALPTGVLITRLQLVSAIQIVIEHLKWIKFVYIGHSMGAELGLFYNSFNPGKVAKLVLLDVKPGLQRLQMTDFPTYFRSFYQEYYDNYVRYTVDDRQYNRDGAAAAVMKARGLTRLQADVILERNLRKIGHDKYKLSWDRRLKILAPINFSPEFYIEIFSKYMPPSLFIHAKEVQGNFYTEGRVAVDRICEELSRRVQNMYMVEVNGGHDVHFTNPERLQRHVCEFLNRNFECRSKL